MAQYIDKSALVAEIEKLRKIYSKCPTRNNYEHGLKDGRLIGYEDALYKINAIEVKEPYEQTVQYDSIKAGIQAHAETYSFNIESLLFHQLTKEQQALWRKEIEQACISGGEAGYELARDMRYKENLEVKEVDLEKELNDYGYYYDYVSLADRKELVDFAKHFFELGLKTQKGE